MNESQQHGIELDNRLTHCERDRTCLIPTDRRNYMMLQRRVSRGQLVKPYPGMFARTAYWTGTDTDEQHRIIARTLQRLHPEWTFAGITAACVWRLDHGRYLDRNAAIFVAAINHDVGMNQTKQLRRQYLPRWEFGRTVVRDGVRVTGIVRTLFDCGRQYAFRDAMPFFDSAIRAGYVTREELVAAYDVPRLGRNQHKPRLLARYANGLSENGGESFCYATMMEEGAATPQQQVEFTHPDDPRRTLRVDFCWTLDDGSIVVAEFDGARKYVDPKMVGSRTVGDVVAAERDRQELLQRCRVARTVRMTFDDVWRRTPMMSKLSAAGIPMGYSRNLTS
ncbi:hypothetical protein JS528_04250 [Bifidobacterium sp. MA2]|uniref:CTP synthase n=1 Tax=Bifidobacterium santillanense TaxID=2809028 RepID=A0ABS5UNV5_9BIFI|nr:hypothetical protein [Bifidobacterium santillanense]MBT1172580.1 hypothetical protein [Bifidobacterium santillanense]